MAALAVTDGELADARRECARLIRKRLSYAAKPPEPRYQVWCYCSWCPLSALLTPHYRRQNCPPLHDYVSSYSPMVKGQPND